MEKGHYVWMNAADGKVYCIPDGYEVVDKSLEARDMPAFFFGGVRHEHIMTLIQLVQDIKYNLHPNFDEEAGYCMARNVELTH